MKINIRVKMRKDLNILILDNSTALRRNIITILKQMGFRGKVFESSSLESATKFIEAQENIEYFIFDWDQTDGSGLEFLKKIRSTEEYGDVPVMILSNIDDLSPMLEALEQGASNYVTKPVQVDTFIERFQTAYEKHYKDEK